MHCHIWGGRGAGKKIAPTENPCFKETLGAIIGGIQVAAAQEVTEGFTQTLERLRKPFFFCT